MARDHQFGLEAFQVPQEPFVAPQVEAVLVDVIGVHARTGLVAHAAFGGKEGLITGVDDPGSIDLHADHRGEPSVSRHGMQRDGDVLPVYRRLVRDMAGHLDGLVPEAGAVVFHRVLEQVAELLARQDLSPENPLEHGNAVDVIVMEMGDERGVDTINAEALFQAADSMEDRTAVGNVGFGRLETGFHIVAIVDGHDLAGVAKYEMGLRAGVLRTVKVGQHLFYIVFVGILERCAHARRNLLEAL